MDDRATRVALQRYWDASDANDFEIEHDVYREDAVLDYPQSGERIHGRRNIQESIRRSTLLRGERHGISRGEIGSKKLNGRGQSVLLCV